MERVLGPQLGDFVRAIHEQHGVIFHLRDSLAAIEGRHVKLKSGGTLEADLVVAGIGVRPRLALAEEAGLALDRGVVVDAFLETNGPDIYAAAQRPEGQVTEVGPYMFPRPGDPKPVAKVSYVMRVADLGCGVGYYK